MIDPMVLFKTAVVLVISKIEFISPNIVQNIYIPTVVRQTPKAALSKRVKDIKERADMTQIKTPNIKPSPGFGKADITPAKLIIKQIGTITLRNTVKNLMDLP